MVENAPSPANDGEADEVVESGADIVRKFYEGINDQDLASVEELIAEKCVYEDLVFPRPFVGRKVPHLSYPVLSNYVRSVNSEKKIEAFC